MRCPFVKSQHLTKAQRGICFGTGIVLWTTAGYAIGNLVYYAVEKKLKVYVNEKESQDSFVCRWLIPVFYWFMVDCGDVTNLHLALRAFVNFGAACKFPAILYPGLRYDFRRWNASFTKSSSCSQLIRGSRFLTVTVARSTCLLVGSYAGFMMFYKDLLELSRRSLHKGKW